MSSENIKKVYILNLDKKRIVILTGLFFIFFGLTFLAGLKWENDSITQPLDTQFQKVTADSVDAPLISTNITADDKGFLTLPEEDNRIFNKKSQIDEDPFLLDPPSRDDSSKKINHSNEKLNTKSIEKNHFDHKNQNSERSDRKFYTIQLAAFVHEKDANLYKKDLIKKGLDARVDKGTRFYFVRVGKAEKKDELSVLFKKVHDTMKIKSVLVQRKIS